MEKFEYTSTDFRFVQFEFMKVTCESDILHPVQFEYMNIHCSPGKQLKTSRKTIEVMKKSENRIGSSKNIKPEVQPSLNT